jgi:hypothetical protein
MYDVIYSTRIFIQTESLPKQEIEKVNFEKEIERFKSELIQIDQLLANKPLDVDYSKRLLQGPFSDILTHIGQLSMLQRLVKNPIDWEDFSSSNIKTGLSF